MNALFVNRGKHFVLHVAIVVIFVALGAGVAALKWFSRDLPSMARLEMIEPALKTRILAADSTVIAEFFEQNRIFVPLEEIPPIVQQTFIAVEDKRFYDHFGIDLVRLLSVAWRDLVHWSRAQGASTISQQLARDLFLTKEQTFPRKIKEALLALRIERTYSKDEILEMYLNQIYFGVGAYGIEATAQRVFDRSVNELELHQLALLSGLQRNPAGYDPFRHKQRALRRRNVVLGLMEEGGIITAAQRDSLRLKPLDTAEERERQRDFAAYFTEYIRLELRTKYGGRSILRDGLTVYTTLDADLQRAAEDSLESFIVELENRNGYELTRRAYLDSVEAGVELQPAYLQSAAIALDPRTGHILAMVGGRSFHESEWNRAVQMTKQPGSAFKTFVYIAALENGYSPSDILLDTPVVIEMPNGEVYKPRNFSKKFHGAVTLRHALNKSINVPAVKLLQKIGAPSVIDVARRLGIKSRLMPYLSLALGAQELTLLELTSAFGVLAAEGVRAEPMAIIKIVDRRGNVIEENRERREAVMSPEIAFLATDMLRTVVDDMEEGTGRSARWMGLRIPCAGKTGTTDDYGNGWFIGYSPDIAVGVWTGFDQKRFMGRNQTGAVVALPIWTDIMIAAHPGGLGPDFFVPETIVEAVICEETGLLATPYCKRVRRERFIGGHEPTRVCDLHRVSPYDMLDPDRDFRELDREASRDREIPPIDP